MEENSNRAEALRLLGIAEKLLQNRDFNASRDFAVLAQETEPLLDGSDQIVAVADVLLTAERRVNNHHDWYAILQIDRRSDDHDLIKKQYRRLALLLHPDKNKFAFADQAFKLVADAWAVLSNSSKKSLYDKELSLFTKVDLSSSNSKLPVRRAETMNQTRNVKKSSGVNNNNNSSSGDPRSRLLSFWTACPYCYGLFEYPRVYIGCCLKCQNCNRAFHAVLIQNLPPVVPGKEAYYCCWSLFPLGFVMGNPDDDGKAAPGAGAGFPNWIPPMFPAGQQQQGEKNASVAAPAPARGPVPSSVSASKGAGRRDNVVPVVGISDWRATNPAPRKRGRPRKNPL